MKKKLIALLLVCVMLLGTVAVSADNTQQIRVFVNDKQATFDVPPEIVQDRLMLPVRKIGEMLNCEVQWDASKKLVTLKNQEVQIELTIEVKTAKVNGKDVELDVPPLISKDRTLVPLRFVAENFKSIVLWDEKSRSVDVKSLAYIKAQNTVNNANNKPIPTSYPVKDGEVTVLGSEAAGTEVSVKEMDDNIVELTFSINGEAAISSYFIALEYNKQTIQPYSMSEQRIIGDEKIDTNESIKAYLEKKETKTAFDTWIQSHCAIDNKTNSKNYIYFGYTRWVNDKEVTVEAGKKLDLFKCYFKKQEGKGIGNNTFKFYTDESGFPLVKSIMSCWNFNIIESGSMKSRYVILPKAFKITFVK